EFFEKSVRPILANHCFECHGPLKHKGGLRLDSRDGMLKGGDTGPAIIPGHPEQSLLIKAIGYKDEPQMPPKGQLPVAQIEALTQRRRLYFAWIGMPPTPAEVEEFVAAWEASSAKRQALLERVVDRLLASPHHGERWARHWLDVARYGEDQAHTFQARKYPQGFRYRDWLIKAFNDDMPYDRFIREQLAADLL